MKIENKEELEFGAVKKLIQSLPTKMTSVRELSLTNLFDKAGISKTAGRKVLDVLKGKGFIESEGRQSGLRYMLPKEVGFRDIDTITTEVMETIRKEKISTDNKTFLAYESKGSATKKKRKLQPTVMKVSRYHPGEWVYCIHDNKPKRGVITLARGEFSTIQDGQIAIDKMWYQVAFDWNGSTPLRDHRQKTMTTKVYPSQEMLLESIRVQLRSL